jgi:hypothetical protein
MFRVKQLLVESALSVEFLSKSGTTMEVKLTSCFSSTKFRMILSLKWNLVRSKSRNFFWMKSGCMNMKGHSILHASFRCYRYLPLFALIDRKGLHL